MKRKLIAVALLLGLVLCGCSKEETVKNTDVNDGAGKAVETATPISTNIPDEDVTVDAIEGLFDAGISEADKAASYEKKDKAMRVEAGVDIPYSLTEGYITDASMIADCYASKEGEVKVEAAVSMNGEQLLELNIFTDKDMRVLIEAPLYTNECLGIPVDLTNSFTGEPLDLSAIDTEVFSKILPMLKKSVISSLKFEKIAKDYCIGKMDKSVSGTAYISKVNVATLVKGIEDVADMLMEAGVPVTIDETDAPSDAELTLVYIKNKNGVAIEIIGADREDSIEFINEDKGMSLYFYSDDTEDCTEIFRYDTTGKDSGTFYIYLDDAQISGDIEMFEDKYFTITDLLIADELVINTVAYNKTGVSIKFISGEEDDAISLDATLGKDAGLLTLSLTNVGETAKVQVEYDTIPYKSFTLPTQTTEDVELFLGYVLEGNEALSNLLIGEEEGTYEYDEEYDDWDGSFGQE